MWGFKWDFLADSITHKAAKMDDNSGNAALQMLYGCSGLRGACLPLLIPKIGSR